jgi:competence protein ComFC
LTTMLSLLLDILFPARCAGCGKPAASFRSSLCPSCAGAIPYLSECCPVCSGPLAGGTCNACTERHWYPAKNIIVAEYRGVIKAVMQAMKFKKLRYLHAFLGSLALNKLAQDKVHADVITWVPMNRKKRWNRGFNQSELIAKYISKRAGMPNRSLLMESRNAETQRNLGLRSRFINSLNRYTVAERAGLDGCRVLLVDDVFTTGATINECARQLVNAGAREVISLTIARADIKRLEMI